MKNSIILNKTHMKNMTRIYHFQDQLFKIKIPSNKVIFVSPDRLTLASRYNHESRQITIRRPQIAKSNSKSNVRQVEFIFSQTAPVVCLSCKQTDFITRIIALFRALLYRVTLKKLFKIENIRSK